MYWNHQKLHFHYLHNMFTIGKRFVIILIAVIVLLSVPFTAMQFSDEVNWSVFDFLVMGSMLLLVGTSIGLVSLIIKSFRSRLMIIGVIILIFLLIWLELAVGIIGTPFAGN